MAKVVPEEVTTKSGKKAKLAGVSRKQELPFEMVMIVSPTGKKRMEKRPK